MTFGAARLDVTAPDARPARGGKADRSPVEKGTSSFGGALAAAQGRDGTPRGPVNGEAAAQTGSATTGDRSHADEAKAVSPVAAPRSGSTALAARFPSATAPALDAHAGTPGEDGSIELSIDALPADEGKPAPTAGSTGVQDAAGTLLDQILQQENAKRPDDTASPGATVPAAAPDLLMLLVGASAKPVTMPNATGEVAISAAAGTLVQSVIPRRTEAPDATPASMEADAQASTDTKTAFAGIAVETHLGPVASPVDRSGTAGQEPSPHEVSQGPTAQATDATPAKDAPSVVAGASDAHLPRRAAEPPTPAVDAAMPTASPVLSIASAIVELASRAASAAPTDPTTPPAPPAPIARTLTLQLSPANLGTVDIRMHMSGGALDVELSISDTTTLGLVSRERDALASALHDSTYTLHSLVIQDGGASLPPGGHHDTSGNTAGGDPRPDRSGGDADPGQRGGGGRGQSAARPSEPGADRRDPSGAPPVDRRGSLFI